MISLVWSGGEHQFALKISHLRALQQACDAGPGMVLQRLETGVWMVDDIIATLRLGLEGGGMDKSEATRLVLRAADIDGLRQLAPTAFIVLSAALSGVKDDPVGERQGVSQTEAAGSSAGSTPEVLAPVSPPETSTT